MLEAILILLLLLDDGGAGKFNALVNVCFVCYWVYKIFWFFKNNNKKQESESAKAPLSWMEILMLQLPVFKGLSTFLRNINPSFVPFMIASNFISEIPMQVLFLLICTGWPFVKKPLLLLRKKIVLLLFGYFFIELCLIPYFTTVLFPEDIYNPKQSFESFTTLKFVLLFQAFKSSTIYLKEQGIATKIFRSMLFYYPSYLVFRGVLAYLIFYNNLMSLAFFVVIAHKFVPDMLFKIVADDEYFLKLLKARHPLLFKSSTT